MNFASNRRGSSTSASTRSPFTVVRGRGQQSGAEVTIPAARVARWRDGLCVYFKAYAHSDALSDLGVKEDELEPMDP